MYKSRAARILEAALNGSRDYYEVSAKATKVNADTSQEYENETRLEKDIVTLKSVTVDTIKPCSSATNTSSLSIESDINEDQTAVIKQFENLYSPNQINSILEIDADQSLINTEYTSNDELDDPNFELNNRIDKCLENTEYNSDDSFGDPNFELDDEPASESSEAVSDINIIEHEQNQSDHNEVEQELQNNIGTAPATPKRKRRKIAAPNEWKQNKRKLLRQAGESYTSVKGKQIPAKALVQNPCENCPRKCGENINEGARQVIFDSFKAISQLDRQRQYVAGLIETKPKDIKRTLNEQSRRQFTMQYHLIHNQEKIQVCKKFFQATLCISEKFTRTALQKCDQSKVVANDKRGKHKPSISRLPSAREDIRQHINCFPRVPSHYARKSSSKEYLEEGLSIPIMYDLYVQKCQEANKPAEKMWLYRNVFHTDFNLAFHTPKKDMCDVCYKYKHMTEEEKQGIQNDYNKHVEKKNRAREEKQNDKDRAIRGECHTSLFDLEGVCYIPHTNAKTLFYKTRLSAFNLTIFDTETKHAKCYVWHEGLAGRGSAEISSCVYNYLKSVADGKEVNLYSDTCGGQNRNANISSMFLYAVSTLNVPIINQKFFEPGHSQMEVDSVHAKIETMKKRVHIFDPSGWYTVIRAAAKKIPYEVIELSQDDVFDFRKVSSALIKNRKIDTDDNNVQWLKIVWLQYRKDDVNHIYFKYSMDAEKIKVVRRGRSGKVVLNRLYNGPLPIRADKLNNLKELCRMDIIKKPYHAFYENLTSGDVQCNSSDSDE